MDLKPIASLINQSNVGVKAAYDFETDTISIVLPGWEDTEAYIGLGLPQIEEQIDGTVEERPGYAVYLGDDKIADRMSPAGAVALLYQKLESNLIALRASTIESEINLKINQFTT